MICSAGLLYFVSPQHRSHVVLYAYVLYISRLPVRRKHMLLRSTYAYPYCETFTCCLVLYVFVRIKTCVSFLSDYLCCLCIEMALLLTLIGEPKFGMVVYFFCSRPSCQSHFRKELRCHVSKYDDVALELLMNRGEISFINMKLSMHTVSNILKIFRTYLSRAIYSFFSSNCVPD